MSQPESELPPPDGKPTNPKDDSATAYHEAGHAVVAIALGRPVQLVTITPDRHRLGRCEFGKGKTRPTDDWLEREMLITLAGVAAEAVHTNRYSWGGATQDLKDLRRLSAMRAGERQAEKLERRMLSKVEHLLSKAGHWRAVELIAAELLRCGSISGRAARHLFDQGVAHADDLR